MTTPFQIASRAAVVGALTVASALWTLPGRAGIHEDEAGTLQLVINAKLEKAVDELIDPEVVARELFLPYPVEPPTKQKDEIEAEIQAKVTAMGDEKYADQTDEYFSKLALFHWHARKPECPGRTIILLQPSGENDSRP